MVNYLKLGLMLIFSDDENHFKSSSGASSHSLVAVERSSSPKCVSLVAAFPSWLQTLKDSR